MGMIPLVIRPVSPKPAQPRIIALSLIELTRSIPQNAIPQRSHTRPNLSHETKFLRLHGVGRTEHGLAERTIAIRYAGADHRFGPPMQTDREPLVQQPESTQITRDPIQRRGTGQLPLPLQQ